MSTLNILILVAPFIVSLGISFFLSRKDIKEMNIKRLLPHFPLRMLIATPIVILLGEAIFYTLFFTGKLGQMRMEGGPIEIVWIPFIPMNFVLGIIVSIIIAIVLQVKLKRMRLK